MPYTKQTLQTLYNLSVEDVNETLSAGKLPTARDEYTDEEIKSSFDVIRSYFASEQVKDYRQAAELFELQTRAGQQPAVVKQLNGTESSNAHKPTEVMGFSEMRDWVSETIQTRVSWKEAGEILLCCGLPDQDKYTESEAERFLEACDLIKKQELTYEEVAAHFGVGVTSNSANLQQITEQVSLAAMSTEEGLVRLVDKVTDKQAENLPEFVQQSYLKNASRRLAESRANNDLFFAELEKQIMTRIEGKSQARSLMAQWEREANSLPPSSPKRMSLPEGSDDGTNGE